MPPPLAFSAVAAELGFTSTAELSSITAALAEASATGSQTEQTIMAEAFAGLVSEHEPEPFAPASESVDECSLEPESVAPVTPTESLPLAESTAANARAAEMDNLVAAVVEYVVERLKPQMLAGTRTPQTRTHRQVTRELKNQQ